VNESDIEYLQQALGLQLPNEYRSILQDYPFEDDSDIADSQLWNDSSLLVSGQEGLSEMLQEATSGQHSASQFFQIGFDGGEELYLIDLNDDSSPVYAYDLEQSAIAVKSSSIDTWVAECRQLEAELLADEMEIARQHTERRWWQFWK
jgi:SMI1 / KNR4 family (SUKH-1)